jgi:hypothetical protein
MLLPSLISLRHPTSTTLSPEEIFGSSLGGIFTDDLQNQHGRDPDTVVLYRPSNYAYPELEFRTADINGEEERTKFAHYLWNAGVLIAEVVGGRGSGDSDVGDDGGWQEGEWWIKKEEEYLWNVEGKKVLELGAGSSNR